VADPINLNKARKAKQRAGRETAAAANRAKFGRTKAEKLADKAQIDRAARKLEQTKREP
jgi:hypothetical protein